MDGLLALLLSAAAIVLLFRHLRRREIAAFRDADLSVFEEFRTERRITVPNRTNPIEVGNVVKLPTVATPPEIQYQLRESPFDEVYRNFLHNLGLALGDGYVVFPKIPLTEFIKADSPLRLTGKTLAFLICKKTDLSIFCGVHLKDAGADAPGQSATLREIFDQITRPLLEFPVRADISVTEIREQLQPLLNQSLLSRNCPKCGQEMTMRKAVKGRNAGKTFWVCSDFPSCSGVTRIGRF